MAYAALAVLPLVPWAPLKFAVLVGGKLLRLGRSRESTAHEPSAIELLQGRVAARDAAILLFAPVFASLGYAVVWGLELSDDVVSGLFAAFSGLQAVAGLVAFIWAV